MRPHVSHLWKVRLFRICPVPPSLPPLPSSPPSPPTLTHSHIIHPSLPPSLPLPSFLADVTASSSLAWNKCENKVGPPFLLTCMVKWWWQEEEEEEEEEGEEEDTVAQVLRLRRRQ